MKVGIVLPQGWVLEYAGWEADRAWARTVALARQAELLRDVVERVGFVEMRLHVCAGPRNDALHRALGGARLAPQARAKARPLGGLGIRVERHVRAQRSPGLPSARLLPSARSARPGR